MRLLPLSFLILGLGAPAWAQQTGGSGVYYPAAAQAQGLGGRVTLECLVGDDGRLVCETVDESPADMDFGAAALAMSEHWRVAPRARDGQSTVGGRIRRTLVFEPGPPARVDHESPPR